MDLLSSDHTVPLVKADRSPKKNIDPTPQYATDGDPAQGIPATILTAAHYNSLMDEVVNAIIAGGLDPNKDDWGQLASIITKFINQIDGLNRRFDTIKKEVGKDANGVYVIYEESGQDQKKYILSPSDLDDINKRLSAAEGAIVKHTERLDSAEQIIQKHTTEIAGKAQLNGDPDQNFDAKDVVALDVKAGGMAVHGGVLRFDARLGNPDRYVRSWSFNQNPNDNNNLYIIGFDRVNPDDEEKFILFMGICKENPDYKNTSTLTIHQTLIAPKKGDLAELYEADKLDYIPGQIMMFGGNKEITLCTDPKNVFGVYSSDPAYILNGDKTEYHIPIALIGRVSILIEGPIRHEDKITPTDHGTGIVSRHDEDIIIGRPIHDDLNEGIRLVECFVKAVI